MKKAKICLSVSEMDREFENLVSRISTIADIDVVGLSDFSLSGYDIFIGKKLSPETLSGADCLRAIFAYKTGVDDFPLDEIKKKGVILVNSHVDAHYIAEYALALAFSLVSRITECDKKLRRGIWYDTKNPYWRSMFSMKVGLVGYGHIGRAVHSLLSGLSIPVYTVDRGHEYKDIGTVDSLFELCRLCDLIIISLPKTPETDGMFSADIFKALSGKYIVNVGRSNCIDEAALYEALQSGLLGGAAIDTWEEKPKAKDQLLQPSKYPLADLENIVLSPHRAMFVEDGHRRYVLDTADKVISYVKGEPLQDIVDLNKGY